MLKADDLQRVTPRKLDRLVICGMLGAAVVLGCAGAGARSEGSAQGDTPSRTDGGHEDAAGDRVIRIQGAATVGPFAGRYWPFVACGAILVGLVLFIALHVMRLNGRLRESIAAERRQSSERERTQRALQESEERLNKLVAAAQDAIVILDPEGNISMWNEAAQRIFGYSAEETLGQNLHELLAPCRFREQHRSAFHEFRRSGTGNAVGRVLELAALRKGGEEFPVELSLSAVRLRDAWHTVGVLRDITDRKRLALQQEQYAIALEGQKQAMEELCQAAEAAARAKSEFLANMSHEIRTPMTAILGYAELLDESLHCCAVCPDHATCKTRAQNRTHVATIRRNGDHLLEILNEILNLSKIEAGKFQVEWQACSPEAILADVVSSMRVRAEAKGLTLKLEFAGPMPEAILTDPSRLRQILLNLIGNAIKFTGAGSVRVVARVADRQAPKPKFVCEIIDTGVGMTAEQILNLFQPFHQADASTSRKFGGTGLGLAISKRLAELLRGDIAAASQPGQGSTFVLTVDPGPLADVAFRDHSSKSVAAPTAASATGGPLPALSGRILLAEDGVDNQRLISFLLRTAGAEVATVENGREAMETALAALPRAGRREDDSEKAFDVILMDMQMPVMDGYESVRRLRAEGYFGRIIALTAHAMAGERQKCLEAGCDDYMAKPIDRAKLLQTIASHLPPAHAPLKSATPVGPCVAGETTRGPDSVPG